MRSVQSHMDSLKGRKNFFQDLSEAINDKDPTRAHAIVDKAAYPADLREQAIFEQAGMFLQDSDAVMVWRCQPGLPSPLSSWSQRRPPQLHGHLSSAGGSSGIPCTRRRAGMERSISCTTASMVNGWYQTPFRTMDLYKSKVPPYIPIFLSTTI